MKKITKVLTLVLLVVMGLTVLTACGNISQSYADKINKAAEKGEPITYTQVLEDLGENAIDFTFLKTGVVIAVQGCKTAEDIRAKFNEGKTVKGIIVTMAAGKAISAEYTEITEDDLK